MDVLKAIYSRKSIRRYDTKDVPDELIGRILEAGTQAPSVGNTQAWEFVVIKDKETKRQLSIASLNQEHVEKAPVLIVVCANLEKISRKYKDRGKNLYSIQDTAACTQNMLLAAHALGLGTCWVGAFEENKVKDILHLPKRLRPLVIITVGFPLSYEDVPKRSRIPFENLSWTEKHGISETKHLRHESGEWEIKTTSLEKQAEELKEKISEKLEERKKIKEKTEPTNQEEIEKESFADKFLKKVKKIAK